MKRWLHSRLIVSAVFLAAIQLLLLASAAPAGADNRLGGHPHLTVVEQTPGNHAAALVTGTGFQPVSLISITVRVPTRNIQFTYADVTTTDSSGAFSYTFAVYMFAGDPIIVTATDAARNQSTRALVVS